MDMAMVQVTQDIVGDSEIFRSKQIIIKTPNGQKNIKKEQSLKII